MAADDKFAEKSKKALDEMPILATSSNPQFNYDVRLDAYRKHFEEESRKLEDARERAEMERDNLEIDMHDAETIMQRSLICAKTDDCDDCDVKGEPLADALAFLKTHGWKDGKPPEQLREFVTKHRQEKEEAERAVKLLTDHYFTSVDLNGLLELCKECNKRDGCTAEDNEPCPAFIQGSKRFAKFAPVRTVLDRMKA